MSSLSQQVHQIADQLPPEATWEDVRHLVEQRADDEKLKAEIRKGLESGEAEPWDVDTFKRKARARLDAAA